MPYNAVTFLGFASLLAWLQTSDYLRLARDAAVHNGSLAACAVFALALLLYGLLNRLLALEPRRGALLGVAVAASACGVAYTLCPNDHLKLPFFCGQMACGALLVVSWGERLTLFPYRTLMPLVAAAGLGSAAAVYVCSLFPLHLSLIASGALPACSGLCLFALKGSRPVGDPGEPAVTAASSDFFTFEPIEREALRRMPWMLVVVLCLCTFAASLFGGLATNPYLTNSQTVTATMLALTAAGMLVIGGGGWLCLSRRDDERPGDPALLTQCMTGLALIELVAGLLLFSMRLPGTMTTALGMVLSAKNCLVMLCWIVFARAVADARLPFIPCFALLILASGALYVPYLGAYVNKSVGIGFGALTSTATATIAFVAVLAVLYMVVRMRQLGAEQRQAKPEPAEPLSLEDLRNALRAHREGMMVPYGLTEREREIALMILDGQTMGGIAEQLFITERTVKFHSKNAYEKLGVHSKKELMQMFSDL